MKGKEYSTNRRSDETFLSKSWINEKNTIEIDAGVMKESLLSRSWINEKNSS